jgi:hypothetical protein
MSVWEKEIKMPALLAQLRTKAIFGSLFAPAISMLLLSFFRLMSSLSGKCPVEKTVIPGIVTRDKSEEFFLFEARKEALNKK